jgi:hypothetical protein
LKLVAVIKYTLPLGKAFEDTGRVDHRHDVVHTDFLKQFLAAKALLS